ncbi:MAG TPA: hypothetical protein GX692_02770 [Acholeplasmataceae bacterium]|nr:hypothetical protein [Acholeplasmataceae bacterium]
MGKEKKRSVDEQEKEETTFYYELIGIVFIIFSITVLGELGKIGSFMLILFKVAFGDWYWLIILFLLFYGFQSLLRHKSFNFKNQRFIGFVFITFSLLLFAHFPLHNYVNRKSTNYFSETWSVYKSFINTNVDSYLGGGIIGAIMFYAIYYLFGSVGVVLIGVIIILFGFSLIINKPLIDIFKSFGKGTKNIGKYAKSFNNFFKYQLGSGRKEKTVQRRDIFSRSQQIPLKIFEEFQNVMNYNFQEKHCYEMRSLIHSVFNNLHIEYKDVDLTISYKVSSFRFTIFSEYNLKAVMDRLNNVIEEDILFAQDGTSLMIQVTNKFPQILTIRELLMKQASLQNNYLLPLGLTYENKLCEIDITRSGNLLLIGSKNSGIKNFINYYICALFVKENLINYQIEIYDKQNEFFHLQPLLDIESEQDINDYLNKVIEEIDSRLETINNYGTTTIDEYNKKLDIEGSKEPKMQRKFIIINHFQADRETYSYFENKLMYVTQLGEKAGISTVYVVREEFYITSIIMSLYAHKLVFKLDSIPFSVKVMNNENATYLQSHGDSFYLSQIKARRIQTALVSKKDIEAVIEYLK